MYRILALILLITTPETLGETVYSYVDEGGTRVFTNLGNSRSSLSETNSRAGLISNYSSNPYLPLIRQLSSRYQIDERLVQAIVQVESSYDPFAVSPKGCKGLMQLHPDTARRFGVREIFHPEDNLEGGIKYLRFLTDHFKGDLPLVLAAYNAGENAVMRHGGIPPYEETISYVDKVGSLYDFYAQETLLPPTRSRQHLHRVVSSDGRVLFTNTPTQQLEVY